MILDFDESIYTIKNFIQEDIESCKQPNWTNITKETTLAFLWPAWASFIIVLSWYADMHCNKHVTFMAFPLAFLLI